MQRLGLALTGHGFHKATGGGGRSVLQTQRVLSVCSQMPEVRQGHPGAPLMSPAMAPAHAPPTLSLERNADRITPWCTAQLRPLARLEITQPREELPEGCTDV